VLSGPVTCPPETGPHRMLVWALMWAGEEAGRMGKRGHTTEEIVRELREAEVLLAKGMTIPQAARELGVTDHTYYRGVCGANS
jgi:hypothetical protein